MLTPNKQYQELKDTYLFNTIYRKTDDEVYKKLLLEHKRE